MNSHVRRKSKDKQQVVRALYKGNQQTMMRESMGIVTETIGGVFRRQCVQNVFTRRRVDVEVPSHVYVSIDPSGGGSSKFAICSVVRQSTGIVVSSHTQTSARLTARAVQIVGLDHAHVTGRARRPRARARDGGCRARGREVTHHATHQRAARNVPAAREPPVHRHDGV